MKSDWVKGGSDGSEGGIHRAYSPNAQNLPIFLCEIEIRIPRRVGPQLRRGPIICPRRELRARVVLSTCRVPTRTPRETAWSGLGVELRQACQGSVLQMRRLRSNLHRSARVECPPASAAAGQHPSCAISAAGLRTSVSPCAAARPLSPRKQGAAAGVVFTWVIPPRAAVLLHQSAFIDAAAPPPTGRCLTPVNGTTRRPPWCCLLLRVTLL